MKFVSFLTAMMLVNWVCCANEKAYEREWNSIIRSLEKTQTKLLGDWRGRADSKRNYLKDVHEAIADKTWVSEKELNPFINGILDGNITSLRKYAEIITALAAIEYD